MNPKLSSMLLLVFLGVAADALAETLPVNIALVTVGDPGNVADPLTGYGNVPYTYSIGEFDVTLGQYAAFLNSVATASDPYGLYTPAMATDMPTCGILQASSSGTYSYAVKGNGQMPVFDVTWGDAARFVNWLANGQPTSGTEAAGTTETGTYALNGGTSNAALMAVTRSSTATWVLPNLNEWYKASYYFGGGTNSAYWLYATQNNATPSNVLSATGRNNANFFSTVTDTDTDPVNILTPVGAFEGSPGPYGTYDQSGDVWEWNESAYSGVQRGIRGGGYADGPGGLESNDDGSSVPTAHSSELGFRVANVASVPEPGTFLLLFVGAIVAALHHHFCAFGKGA